MNEEKIATTYKEYKNGVDKVAGLGRLGCYKGVTYLHKLLEEDEYYSEELEDFTVMIEWYINHIEKENKKYKEVIDKAISLLEDDNICSDIRRFEPKENENKYGVEKELLDILKEVY